VVPWRGIVELTFAWLGRHRRINADMSALPETNEALIANRDDSAHGPNAAQMTFQTTLSESSQGPRDRPHS